MATPDAYYSSAQRSHQQPPSYQHAHQPGSAQQRQQLVANQHQCQPQPLWPTGAVGHGSALNIITEEEGGLGPLLTPGEEQLLLEENVLPGGGQHEVPQHLLEQLVTTSGGLQQQQAQHLGVHEMNFGAHQFPTPSTTTEGSPLSSDPGSNWSPPMTQIDPKTPESAKSQHSSGRSSGHSWPGSSPHSHGNSSTGGFSPCATSTGPLLDDGTSPPMANADVVHYRCGYATGQDTHRLSHLPYTNGAP